ncbi:MAG TPA: molybdate ABC transporter substrate-binding protein [Acidothermaceae bacterium]
MNRNASTVTTLTVATVVAAIGLAGCSSSKKASATSSTAPAASSSAAPASSAGPITPSVSGTVVVFAAASLMATFTTLATNFEQAHPGVKIVPSYGGSDTLATQITEGAPVDVFAAASTTTMATVTKAGDGVGTPTVFAKNSLEIVVSPNNPDHIASLADVTKSGVKLALCASSVPCGTAATKAFAAAKLNPHPVTLEQDVTSVLTKVELGEVDAGIVYQTDVRSAGGKVAGVNFAEAASAINTYPIVVVKTGKNAVAGQEFLNYVVSPAGQKILQAAGFQQP